MEKKELLKLAKNTKEASSELSILTNDQKNNILEKISINLKKYSSNILKKNIIDIENAKKTNKDYSFIDRLTLSDKKIENMAQAIQEIINLKIR